MPILRGVVEFFWNNPIFKWQLKPIKIMYKCWLFQEFGRETRKTCSIIWFISFINFCSNHVSVVNYSIEAEILIILSCICNLFYRKLHVYLLHVIWSPCGSWLVRRNHQIMCSFLLIHRCNHDFFWYIFLFFLRLTEILAGRLLWIVQKESERMCEKESGIIKVMALKWSQITKLHVTVKFCI